MVIFYIVMLVYQRVCVTDLFWLVVLTILKHISQWEGLSHILWKIEVMFQTTNQFLITTSCDIMQ